MSSHLSAAPISRRERPAKVALTRERVVAAALELLRTQGLAKVTMRSVARALDTGHASLYVYVADTEDLHAQLLDAQLGVVVVPAATAGGWRERLRLLLRSYSEVLFAHPGLARMALTTQPSGQHQARLVDAVLGLLAEAGVDDQTAAWAVDLLLLYPTAVAAEHSAEISPALADRRARTRAAAVGTADPARFPHLARLGDELLSGAPEARFGWALDVLVDGILAATTPDRKK